MVIMKQNKIGKLNWNIVNVKQKRNCYYKIEIKLQKRYENENFKLKIIIRV